MVTGDYTVLEDTGPLGTDTAIPEVSAGPPKNKKNKLKTPWVLITENSVLSAVWRNTHTLPHIEQSVICISVRLRTVQSLEALSHMTMGLSVDKLLAEDGLPTVQKGYLLLYLTSLPNHTYTLTHTPWIECSYTTAGPLSMGVFKQARGPSVCVHYCGKEIQ